MYNTVDADEFRKITLEARNKNNSTAISSGEKFALQAQTPGNLVST